MPDQEYLNRINVVGCSGSGKSTLSKRIAERLGHDYVELDALFWKPGWTESTDDELLPKLTAALSGQSWVLDGNYQRTQPLKWQRVQTVVWLDLPYWLIFYQVIVRTLRRSLLKETLWNGNQESLKKAFFSRDSIILWSLTTAANYRERYERDSAADEYRHIHFVRLRSRGEVDQFLDALTRR